ncbi:THO complex subunit 1 [Plecturocebus cupreus]
MKKKKKCTLNQAFRGVLEKEVIHHSSCGNVLATISLAIGRIKLVVKKTDCEARLPGYLYHICTFCLLGDVLDCLPLDQCDTIFTFAEKMLLLGNQIHSIVLGKITYYICAMISKEDYLSPRIVFCGCIKVFLARLFPLFEKSGLNLQSQFNLENVTVFNTNERESTLGQKHTEDKDEGLDLEEGEMGDEEAPTTCSIPIDYNLNPVQCYEKISRKTFLKYSEEVLDAKVLAVFKSYKLDDTQASRKKMEELKTGGERVYFAKVLTSEKLMDLQLSDSNFHRHILLQYLI